MSFKIVAGLLIVLGTSVLGNIYAAKFRQKRDFFVSLENFAVYLKREISFSSNALCEIVNAYNAENEDLNSMLESSKNIFGTENFEKLSFPAYLKKEEKEFLGQYLSRIGRSDRQNELELTEGFIKELKAMKEAENAKCTKTTALSTKLGFSAGVIVFVVIL